MIETKSEAAAIEANSRAFFKESVAKSILAEKDSDQWRFAIISIVQSFELLLKARLAHIHPALVYESVDDPKKYVGIQKAIERVSSGLIGKHNFNERDRKRLNTAITSRNDFTHGAGHYTAQHAQSVYFEVFALVANFYKDIFEIKLIDLLDCEQYNFIVTNMTSKNRLKNRAIEKIKLENIHENYIRECCECLQDTFVTHDGKDTCYTCQHSESIIECPCCGEYAYFEHEFIDLTEHFSSFVEEGRVHIHNRYGTDYDSVCPDCASGERERISVMRDQEQWEYEEAAMQLIAL